MPTFLDGLIIILSKCCQDSIFEKKKLNKKFKSLRCETIGNKLNN